MKAESMQVAPNRLAKEKSPYLLQHANNPVDWYAWGQEAFEKAKIEDKPIILSVGYSTCHWCHVMEEESFENPETAKIMNEHFVSIKVDREERPDIDSVYMNYVMRSTGSGGWPMNVFLTPDRKPFYGGTYFPPRDGYGLPGFKTLLLSIAEAWKNRRNEILQSSESAVQFLSGDKPTVEASMRLDKETLAKAYERYEANFDEEHGGFGRAPKFPRPHALSMILRHWHRSKKTGDEPRGFRMVEKTLTEMAQGGMYDQLGGGFHRYSVDSRWRIPHYEKMLYDQALLVRTYLEAYQITKNEEYARIAGETLDYVLGRMTSTDGGFFSAEDADSADSKNLSKKIEGAYYVWEKSEIEKILSKKEAEIFFTYYGVEEVLYVGAGISRPELAAVTAPLRKKLLNARNKRPRPHLDDKILADWNGLMISSFAFASRVLDEPRYAAAAANAAGFIDAKLKDKNGKLLHRYRDGESAIPATLNDYAFLIYGYLELYQATFEDKWLAESERLAGDMVRECWDNEKGGFFLTAASAEALVARPKELYDGAIPSGNSIAALDLILLSRLTLKGEFQKKAQNALQVFSSTIAEDPTSYPQMLIALDFEIGPSKEIVIASTKTDSVVKNMLNEIHSVFLPNKIVQWDPTRTIDGKTTVYVCENRVCKLPVHTVEELKKMLE